MTCGAPSRRRQAVGAAALLLGPAGAWAHGAAAPRTPWLEGCRALFGDPASLLVLIVMALLMAQPGQRSAQRPAAIGGLAGLSVGSALAAGGAAFDLTVALQAGAVAVGALVAWARPVPAALCAAAAAAAACSVVLTVALAAGAASSGYRIGWLAGVCLSAALVVGNAVVLVRALLGRQPGVVRRNLLRVVGSWSATAALLALMLELSAGGP